MSEFTIERIYIASIEQSNAINAAADKECTRDSMASCYADCLRADYLAREFKPPNTELVDFAVVNAAIVKRWPKGLTYIKERAWKLLEGGAA